jgi:hypothetical protein
MRREMLFLALLIGCSAPDETRDRLQATVRYLASDALKGRRTGTPEGETAARWMATQFEKAGLQKVTLQRFKTKGENGPEGLNVIGFMEGTTDEWVALCCHHDHLGVKDGQIYHGANDNASGCAVLLEVVQRCALLKVKPKRGFLFCSFDAEEILLGGSRFFVGSGLVEVSKIVALVCMDMMGGDFLPRDTTSLYVLGAENSPELKEAVGRVSPIDGLDLRSLGVNVIEPLGEIYARSDYGSFRAKKIPFVFLSTGQPWYYHKPEDDADRLNYGKMEKGAHFVHGLLLEIAALDARPRYQKQQGITVEDLKVVAGILRRLHPEDLDLTTDEIAILHSALEKIDRIVAGGAVTSNDTESLKSIAATLMGFASRRPKGK